MTPQEDDLYGAAKLAGFDAEMGGGGDTVLFLDTPGGEVIAFGYANGPLGYTVFTDSTLGEAVEGKKGGADMPEGPSTVPDQARFIAKVAAEWGAFQTWTTKGGR